MYFDLEKYKESFEYNILRPDTSNEEEGSTDKKNKGDFVLWKLSNKNDNISYNSKWGYGRSGWHIECSVMSSEILGDSLDIHAGGIDLAFPRHENEIAQCQACFSKKWVKYFLHTGHLNIDGLKMSKSLKNFLTISEIVEKSSPESLRILFLQHSWNRPMNYDPDQLKEADSIKKKLFNFKSNIESYIKNRDLRSLNDYDKKALEYLSILKSDIHESFCNNINTSKSLDSLLNFIGQINVMMKTLHSDVLNSAYQYFSKIMKLFGLINDSVEISSKDENIANLLCEYRSNVRQALKSKSNPSVLFDLSDKVRVDIKSLGFAIDDTPQGSVLRKI